MALLSEDSEEGNSFSDEFRWFRGGAVATFAQVEYSIAHLLLRLKDRPDLVSSGIPALPYKAEARARTLREVFDASPALHEFAPDARVIDDNFENFALLRNFLAHGFARIEVQRGEVVIRKFTPLKGGDTWNIDAWSLPRAEIFERGRQIELFGKLVWDFVKRVDENFQLNF